MSQNIQVLPKRIDFLNAENENLMNNLKADRKQLRGTVYELKNVEEQNSKLKSEISFINGKLVDCLEHNSELNEALKFEGRRVRERLQEKDQQHIAQQTELSAGFEGRIQKLNIDKLHLTRRIQNLEKSEKELVLENEKLKTEKLKDEEKYEKLKKQMNSLDSGAKMQLDVLKVLFDGEKEKNQKLQEEIEQLKTKTESFELGNKDTRDGD